jgi:hypothetical protein
VPQSALLRFWRHSAPLVSLATAAGLLLALGLSMPRLGEAPAAGTPRALSPAGGLAMRGDSPVFFTALRPAAPAAPREAPAREEALACIEQMDRTVLSLEKKGQRKEALALAQRYGELARQAPQEHHPRLAYSLNRVGQLFLDRGDLTAAEPSLQQALAIAKRELGPEHPATVWARNRLAGVYQVALNTPPPQPAAVRSVRPGAGAFAAALSAPPAPPAPALRAGGSPYTRLGDPNPYGTVYSFPHPAAKEVDRKSAEQARRTAQALRERIARMGPQQVRTAVVPVLAKALEESPSEQERQAAARALGQLGPAARDAVPALVARLRRAPTAREGQALAHALVQIGPAARDAVEKLEVELTPRDGAPLLEVCQRLQGREGRVGVNDGAACFSVGALRRSADRIHALAAEGVELLVETAPGLSPDAAREMKHRLGDMGPRSVCVLIGKDGPDVRVWASGGLPTDTLSKAVAERCRRKDYDGALAEAVRFVSERAKK